MKWISILGDISIWIILIPLFTGILGYKKLDEDSRLILLVVLGGTIPQVLRPFINNSTILNILYNVYTPFEFIVYWLLFKNKITTPSLKKIIRLTIVVFFCMSFLLVFHSGITNRFLNEWVIISNIIQLIWICLSLMQYYYSDEAIIEKSQPFYWFIIGITSYAACTVVYFSLANFIKNNPNSQYEIIKIIHHFFNIALYLLFFQGLLQNFQSKDPSIKQEH